MERFTERENVLLGYSPQRSLGSPSSVAKISLRNSDVDFHDVFGGPPRRSSINEMRYGSSETNDSSSYRGEEDAVLSLTPWSGSSGMPVFGEQSVNRRRYPSNDFFDDIFRGDDSCSYGSPRRSDRDPFCSNPGSRVSSPVRSLPPKAEPFSSSLPSPLSLPAKVSKAVDFPAFASGNRSPFKYKDGTSHGINFSCTPATPLSRFSNEAIQGQDVLRNDIRPSHHQTHLSHECSLSSEEPSYMTKTNETDIGSNLTKDSKSGETPTNGNQFHFSIYKWASRGVPLLMPLRRGKSSKSREKNKTERCSSSNGRIESNSVVCELPRANLQDIDSIFLDHSISSNTESSKMEGNKQHHNSLLRKSFQNRVKPQEVVKEAILDMPGLKSLDSFHSTVENLPGDVILSDEREETKPHSLPEMGLCEKTKQEIPVSIKEDCKPELKSLQSLLDDNEKQGNDEITSKDERKESVVKNSKVSHYVDVTENEKKHIGKRINSNRAEVNKASLQGPPINSEALGRSRVKGKVKEFVKIFNQEVSSKPKMSADIRSQSSRWKGKGTYGADNEASVSTTGMDGKMPVPNVNKLKTLRDASIMADKNLEQLEKQHSHRKTMINKLGNNSSGQKDASASSSESLLDDSKDILGNIDDPFPEDFLIKELSYNQDELLHTVEEYQDIQVLDVKIRKWSYGKEGNIRSLLSTLQYVLWPESGWKPVPLADIIEGSAVKRAYQKALLYLHPDKLQQKCAASHQKYIAEKVFAILQEAWDHFNSLGSLDCSMLYKQSFICQGQ
ncbi:hypothetical protein F0562_027266 [Nyssa sinensis]|uniref:J domain-containing protein n=1 Tax=Nyssa sinensis TaxID=561372 RepID=A0A5J5B4V3_9ASTE|nr:hypothetical protein F0562_027266 [Nyssa sinensis]